VNNRNSYQHGFSLVELMVGMTIGLILISAVVALTASVLRTNAETVTVAKITQEGRAVSDLVSREVRRARYSGNYRVFVGAAGAVPNAFAVMQINNTSLPTATTGSCLRFAYDADDDGDLGADAGTPDPTEVEVKVISLYNEAVYFGQASTYAGAACVTSAAQAANALRISSPDVRVTSFQFRSYATSSSDVNRIDLFFSLALAGNPAITRRFYQSIQLRNPYL
jgi:prepilin-type N-terminal cleavage/methylation domain-containing protein